MLQWEKGARIEDGIWAKYWYKNIHNSSGFLPYTEKTISLNKKLAEYFIMSNIILSLQN